MRVAFPDGTEVLAHGRLEMIPPERPRDPDTALYFDHRWKTDPIVTWPYTYVHWEDGEPPDEEQDLFRALETAWCDARSGRLVEIACDGGTGRTGDGARLSRRSCRNATCRRNRLGAEQLPPVGSRGLRTGGPRRSLRRLVR